MIKIFTGITAFSFDYASIEFGGSVAASSSPTLAEYAFNNLNNFRWVSQGQGTDGTEAFISRNFGVLRNVDGIMLAEHNFKDSGLFLSYLTSGGAEVVLQPTDYTKKVAPDGTSTYFEFNQRLEMGGFTVHATATISPNQEKRITKIKAFQKIGTFERPLETEPKNPFESANHKLKDGRYIIYNKGERWEFTLKLKSHVNQPDIDLFNKLVNRRAEFYLWICGGNADQFDYKFAPFRFQDIFKVGNGEGHAPNIRNKNYKTGLNDELKLLELA